MHVRRIVIVIIGALSVLAAFFQARGLMDLLRVAQTSTRLSAVASVDVQERDKPRKKGPLFGAAEENTAAEPSASETGPIVCDDIELRILSEWGEQELSLASLVVQGRSMLRPVGARAGSRTLAAVGSHPVSFLPTAWFAGDRPCHVSLHARSGSREESGDREPSPTRSTKTVARATKGIKRVAEGEFIVDRVLFEETLTDPSEFARTVQVVPVEDQGLRVVRVLRGSPLDLLGLNRGDLLKEINGAALSDPAKMLAAYTRLASAERLSLRLSRRGKERSIEIRVQ